MLGSVIDRAALRHRQTRQLHRALDFLGARPSREEPVATETELEQKKIINISGDGQRVPSKISV